MPLGPVLLCDLIAANGRSTRVQVVSAAALLGAAYTKLNREALAPAVGADGDRSPPTHTSTCPRRQVERITSASL